ncbi:hypothetical protein [uncultured Culturomica sp.]|jgi:hypothetical protein|uniref:hypothetical protein n=1 Tax=uncultured Culturomica sp. TaxID=1926654 RepID=UPI000337FC1C|nr:hypothetical protein [uncultured Culturomica sp.]CCZ10498.1 unknown [Odoribacter sp. CAG:788]
MSKKEDKTKSLQKWMESEFPLGYTPTVLHSTLHLPLSKEKKERAHELERWPYLYKVEHISPHIPLSEETKEVINKIAEMAYNTK